MIKSDKQYQDFKAVRDEQRERLKNYPRLLAQKGLSKAEIEVVLALAEERIRELDEEMARYERLSHGELDERSYPFEELGSLLIALRIASGLTQRDFAKRMDVDESQVSRDERHRYAGLTIQRAAKILKALNAKIMLEAAFSTEGNEAYERAPSEHGLHLVKSERWIPVGAAQGMIYAMGGGEAPAKAPCNKERFTFQYENREVEFDLEIRGPRQGEPEDTGRATVEMQASRPDLWSSDTELVLEISPSLVDAGKDQSKACFLHLPRAIGEGGVKAAPLNFNPLKIKFGLGLSLFRKTEESK